jgi:hypothetical protein
MLDWQKDEPNELTIERLGDPPSKPALTVDEQAELTVRFMQRYCDFTQKIANDMLSSGANNFGLAWSRDKEGALRKQFYVGGNYELQDDEAMVIEVSDGGAAYFVVPTGNIWGTTFDVPGRTSSLNKAQSIANADGTYTYVVSRRDPGVHNWIDSCDTRDGILTLRLAEFPNDTPRDDLGATSRVVKLDQVRNELPDETKWVTADERKTQLEARAAGYYCRLPEARG